MLRRLFDSPWLFFGLAGLLLALAVLSQFEFSPKPRPAGTYEDVAALSERDDLNVIFIVIDMLRADRMSAYGYHRKTTPVIEGLAAGGIRFANVEAQSSWTKASMASLWTGMYPEKTGVQRFFHAMPEEAHMPAEIFKEAGYRTAGIWRNGWVANNFGFGQGFDLYIRPLQVRPEHLVHANNRGYRIPGTDMDATLSAIEFMTGAKDQRFFLYVHYMDVHQYLYTDLSPDFGSSFSDFYDSAIFWTDYNIGRLMEALRDLRIVDRTLVVIVSDHGEAFFEHGIEGHARNLYKEVLATPWIIVPPVRLDEGIVVQRRVANVDVWPTILDLLGMPALQGAEGRSAMPLVEEAAAARGTAEPTPEDVETDRVIVAQLDRSWGRVGEDSKPTASLVKGAHRYNYRAHMPDRPELFDHRADPDEAVNIAAEQPELLERMKAELDAFYAAQRAAKPWDHAPEVELDEMRQNQLRALGYVIERPTRKKDADADDADTAAPDATPDTTDATDGG